MMAAKLTGRVLLVASLALAGCFDSLVSAPCAAGFDRVDGRCAAQVPDGGGPGPGDGADGGDAPVCTEAERACGDTCVDTASNPDHCGACGHVCQSGLCAAGACQGGLVGHIIAIGHDYQSQHLAMARVLGNSLALGRHQDIGLARWHGAAVQPAIDGTSLAVAHSLAQLGRPWHRVVLPHAPSHTALSAVDVLVIDPQAGSGDAARAAGASWAGAIGAFLDGGGVVVVLEGAAGVSHRFAAGADLFHVGAPVDATNQPAVVVDPTDAVALQVVSPYLAESTSVTFPGAPDPVIAAASGGTLVFHAIR